MEYNTDKTALRLREYGRNVQHMANYAKGLSDNDEKKKWAELIVQVMSQLNPSVRSMEDYKTKLWQHIGIISEGESWRNLHQKEVHLLKNQRDGLLKSGGISFFEYQRKALWSHIVELVAKVSAMEEGEKKEEGKLIIANYMKFG